MRKGIVTFLSIAVASCLGVALAAGIVYPVAPHDNTVDTYYGVQVPDPYRPLENLDSPQTHAWEAAEEALTQSYLAAIPQRSHIYDVLQQTANYEKIGAPTHEGNQYFYTYNSGLQNQEVWYTKEGPNGTPRVLIDPNQLSPDGTTGVSVVPSRDGSSAALLYYQAGFPWTTIHVRNVATGQDLPDTIQWTKFVVVWKPDGSGFYYDHYTAPKGGLLDIASVSAESIYFHKLGTPQSDDTVIYQDPQHSDYIYEFTVTQDGRYMVLGMAQGTNVNNQLYYADMTSGTPQFMPLIGSMDASYGVIDNDGPIFYIETTLGAPNRRIIAVDIRHPGQPARVTVPETSDNLAGVSTAYHRMFLQYNHDVHTLVKEYTYEGQWIRDVTLPGVGTAGGFDGHHDDRIVYYSFSNYTTPPTTYAYDVVSGTSTVYNQPKIDFDPSQYVTQEVFYHSKDGTRVPLFISYRKGIQLNGQNPTILYGYGGFDIATEPYFDSNVAVWLKMGGIYAEANIRGGSEYGEAWHRGGMVLTKQNVFDDFIAAAEYLIAQGYTSSKKIAAQGGSNGGLLVGAVETERPDLWGAALPAVGVLDMLRYHLWTDGKWWIPDYGCSTCSEDQFKVLYSYSPYHNIKPGTSYPATMVSTSDHDVHVYAAHSLKFAARLQQAQGGSAPILLRIETNSGHGASSLTKNLQETADDYAFLVKNLNMTLPSDF